MFFLPLFLICLLQFAHSITGMEPFIVVLFRGVASRCLTKQSMQYRLALCCSVDIHQCTFAQRRKPSSVFCFFFYFSFLYSLTLTFPFTEGIGTFLRRKKSPNTNKNNTTPKPEARAYQVSTGTVKTRA